MNKRQAMLGARRLRYKINGEQIAKELQIDRHTVTAVEKQFECLALTTEAIRLWEDALERLHNQEIEARMLDTVSKV